MRIPDGVSELAAAVTSAYRPCPGRTRPARTRNTTTSEPSGRPGSPGRRPLESAIAAWQPSTTRRRVYPTGRRVRPRRGGPCRTGVGCRTSPRRRCGGGGAKARADQDDRPLLPPHLHAGADCPVCAQPVAVLPPPLPDAQSAGGRALRAAQQAAGSRQGCAQAAGDERVALGALEGARREIDGHPPAAGRCPQPGRRAGRARRGRAAADGGGAVCRARPGAAGARPRVRGGTRGGEPGRPCCPRAAGHRPRRPRRARRARPPA